MIKLTTNYEDIDITEFEEHIEQLNDAITDNDIETATNIFSAIFIYENDNEQLLLDVYEQVLNSIASNELKASVSFELGVYLEQRTFVDKANIYYDNAINFQKQVDIKQNLTLAMMYMHLKQYENAITEFEKCDLTVRDTAMFLVNCYMFNKQYNEAIDILNKYLQTDAKKPNYFLINNKIGWCYLYLKQFDIAEQYLLKANLINDIHLLIDVSNYYIQIGEKERTLKMYYYMFDLGEGVVIHKIEELEKELNIKKAN